MSAFSSGSFSTDAFSTGAFDFGAAPPPPPPSTPTEQTKGQQPWLFGHDPFTRPRHEPRLAGVEAEIVHAVAARQAEALDVDELQAKEELLREMRLARLEAKAEHFEELATQRQALIDAEIAAYMAQLVRLRDEEAIAMMIMIGASI